MGRAMTTFLAGLMRSLFPGLAAGSGLVALAAAALYGLVSGHVLTAVVLGIGGLLAVLVLFGLVALQIENNRLLRQVVAGRAGHVVAGAQPPVAHSQPRPNLRAEPVVTLRPHATYEAI